MSRPTRVWAPGRINLIGEHTDHTGGLVLPAAIELGLTIKAHPSEEDIRMSSTTFGDAEPFAVDGSGPRIEGWGRFGQAVAAELAALGRPPVGLEAEVSSTLPAGSGLSSSAALEVGVALALCAVADFELDLLDVAQACRRAERRAVGVACGILDQAASLLGRPGHAIMLDCGSGERHYVSVPQDAAFLIVDSGVDRSLENTGYTNRRDELQSALTQMGTDNPRELSLADIDSLDDIPRRRLRHVITENDRVVRFAAALADDDLVTAGRLMSASHASLRDDYEVSIPELDEMVLRLEGHGAFGARLLGGGFGGSVIGLTGADQAQGIATAIANSTSARRAPLVVHASAGACVQA
jgi:galactokinase